MCGARRRFPEDHWIPDLVDCDDRDHGLDHDRTAAPCYELDPLGAGSSGEGGTRRRRATRFGSHQL